MASVNIYLVPGQTPSQNVQLGNPAGTVLGTLSVTEANDTLTAAGSDAIAGALSVTEGPDTLSAAGTVSSAGTTVDTHDGVRHRDRYTVSQWAQINGWLKTRRAKRKEEQARVPEPVLEELEVEEPIKAAPKPLPLSTKARRKLKERLKEALAPIPVVTAAVTTVVEVRAPSFAELRAQLRAEWEAAVRAIYEERAQWAGVVRDAYEERADWEAKVRAAHEDMMEREDEEMVYRFIEHLMADG